MDNNENRGENQSSSVPQPEAINLLGELNSLSNQQEVEQEQASTENWGKEPKVGSSSSVENTFSPIMHENPASVQSPYDQHNQQELDPYVAEIIGLNSGSELAQLLRQETQLASSNPAAFSHPTQQLQQSTHFLSSSQPGHRPQPHRVLPTAHIPAVLGQSSQTEVIQPSANVALNPPAFPHPAQQMSSQGPPTAHIPAAQSSQRGVLQLSANISQPFPQLLRSLPQWRQRYLRQRMGIPAMPTSDDPVRPCQRAIIPPSANVCGRHCQCAAVIAETVPLRDEVARLKIELNNVNCRLEKLEREAVFKPSGGEQSQSDRAISKKYVPPSQDKRRRSTKTPVRRGRSSAKETGGSSPVAAVPPRQAVGTFADLFSNSNKPREASSSSPAAHSPSFLGRIQANVDSQSQGIVFRQRSREAVNDAENLNEPPAQAGRAQHEGADVDSL